MNIKVAPYYLMLDLSFSLQLNKSGIETIEYVNSMKSQVVEIFQNVSKVFNESTDLQNRASEQRQVRITLSFLIFQGGGTRSDRTFSFQNDSCSALSELSK